MAAKFKRQKDNLWSTWTFDWLPTCITWTNVDIWLTTYLPHLVHVVCERPLNKRFYNDLSFTDKINRILNPKGQLISKCLFVRLQFFQKSNENNSTWGTLVVKSNFFVRFLDELKRHFEINWPLVWEERNSSQYLGLRRLHKEYISSVICKASCS